MSNCSLRVATRQASGDGRGSSGGDVVVKKELTIQVLIIPLDTEGTESCNKQHDEESGGSHRGKLKLSTAMNGDLGILRDVRIWTRS